MKSWLELESTAKGTRHRPLHVYIGEDGTCGVSVGMSPNSAYFTTDELQEIAKRILSVLGE